MNPLRLAVALAAANVAVCPFSTGWAAELPTFVAHPRSATVEVGDPVTFDCSVASDIEITYQWQKDQASLPGATSSSLAFAGVVEADAGVYQVIATTSAGSVASRWAILTVDPASLPVITRQPTGGTVRVDGDFTFQVLATSKSPASYQWTRDGVAVSGATETTLQLWGIKPEQAGFYRVTVTNRGGSVTSDAARLLVDRGPPPPVPYLPNLTVQAGQGLHIAQPWYPWGTGNRYQWYKDGAPISGNIGPEYSVSSALFEHAGEYFLTVTNDVGSVTSTAMIATVLPGPDTFVHGWDETCTEGDIVYFLFRDPARIERFDLAAEAWLAPVQLSVIPTAMAIKDGSAYVAATRGVSRIDLTTGEVAPLPVAGVDIVELTTLGEWLVAAADDPVSQFVTILGTLNTRTPTTWRWTEAGSSGGVGLSVDAAHSKVFCIDVSTTSPLIIANSVNPDGSFGARTTSYPFGYRSGKHTTISPGGLRVYDASGVAYDTADFSPLAAMGMGFNALVFGPDKTPIALRTNKLVAFDAGLLETGSVTLSAPAQALALAGDRVFTFKQPTTSGAKPGWERHTLAEFAARKPFPAIRAEALDYSPDHVLFGRDGTVFLSSRLYANIFRWSVKEQRYLSPIALRGRPNHLTYSAELDRLYVGYPDNQVSAIDGGPAPVERVLFNHPESIDGLCAVGEHLLVAFRGSGWADYAIYNREGLLTSRSDLQYFSRHYAWSPVKRRLYQFSDGMSPSDLHHITINPDGTLGASKDSPYHGEIAPIAPIRVSPDGSVVLLGSGVFFDGDTMTAIGALPRAVVDAVWMDSCLFSTHRTPIGVEIERRRGIGSEVDASCFLEGRALRLFDCGDGRMVVVTIKGGRPLFTLLDSELKVCNHFEDTPDLTRTTLANISTRAEVGTGDNIIIAGFVVTGTQPKRVLVRAVGPGLDRFGVSGTLSDPMLRLVSDAGPVAENDNWFTPDGIALRQAFREVSAFSLAEASLDSALVATLPPGKYTAQVSGLNGGEGVALVEAYDLEVDAGERRLINISTRAVVGVGDKVLIPGLVVDGTQPKRLLIRAVGPELARFGVSGVLADPKLEVIDSQDVVVAANDNWSDGNTEVTSAATTASSAFRLTAGGRDAALVATLPSGTYTVVVRGVGDTTGIALVEVYEVR